MGIFILLFIIAFLVILGGILIVGLTGIITFILSLFSIGALATVKRKKKFGNGWYAIPLIPLVISIIMVIPLIGMLIFYFLIV
ncbi:hypothetical protein I6N96_17515 [Enterococcus sp. BWM-S5]|uniref:Uncharacterized protein n=1 Tax=Enterococcus larvae TaxID=2794352 RepID=A0ABS4CNI4_9ENTE|nr:hypothetical protein [Enterococcus larvae]MBP1048094.1 hypothetical protein [Enterococcus larvae]